MKIFVGIDTDNDGVDMVSCIMVLQVREPDAAFRWDRTVMGWRSLRLL
jgi:hypothetical protein